jgi:type I site-specific restriction-modification system R (restriction) subunit
MSNLREEIEVILNNLYPEHKQGNIDYDELVAELEQLILKREQKKSELIRQLKDKLSERNTELKYLRKQIFKYKQHENQQQPIECNCGCHGSIFSSRRSCEHCKPTEGKKGDKE